MMAMVLILVASCQAPNFDELVNELFASPARAEAARVDLMNAGVQAFPALLKHVDDERIVALPHYNVVVSPQTNKMGAEMKLGECVYFIIREQIEGPPSGRSSLHTFLLTRKNVAQWLEQKKGLALPELQIVAAAESIQSISVEIAKSGANRTTLSRMAIMSNRLSKLVKAASDE